MTARRSHGVFERGDLVTVGLPPGQQRALVISPGAYNVRARALLVVPVVGTGRSGPFEVPLGGEMNSAVALADQVRHLDLDLQPVEMTGLVAVGVVLAVLVRARELLAEE